MTIYAIGDLHGQSAELDRLLKLVESDGGPDARIVFLGDLTDRGPDSAGVIQRLVDGRDAGKPWHFVRGNHDRMFLRFATEGRQNDPAIRSGKCWFNWSLGGQATIASYGLVADRPPRFEIDGKTGEERLVRFHFDGQALDGEALAERLRQAVPAEHLEFIETMDRYRETDDLILVHAGIRPGVPMPEQSEDDLAWIRSGFLDDHTDHGKLVVHGHTVVEEPTHFGNRVALDTGAGYGHPPTAAAFEGREVFILTEKGRVPLVPAA